MTDALQERSYALLPDASVQDSSDNTVYRETVYFAGNTRIQQIEPRFERFLPTSTYDPHKLGALGDTNASLQSAAYATGSG